MPTSSQALSIKLHETNCPESTKLLYGDLGEERDLALGYDFDKDLGHEVGTLKFQERHNVVAGRSLSFEGKDVTESIEHKSSLEGDALPPGNEFHDEENPPHPAPGSDNCCLDYYGKTVAMNEDVEASMQLLEEAEKSDATKSAWPAGSSARGGLYDQLAMPPHRWGAPMRQQQRVKPKQAEHVNPVVLPAIPAIIPKSKLRVICLRLDERKLPSFNLEPPAMACERVRSQLATGKSVRRKRPKGDKSVNLRSLIFEKKTRAILKALQKPPDNAEGVRIFGVLGERERRRRIQHSVASSHYSQPLEGKEIDEVGKATQEISQFLSLTTDCENTTNTMADKFLSPASKKHFSPFSGNVMSNLRRKYSRGSTPSNFMDLTLRYGHQVQLDGIFEAKGQNVQDAIFSRGDDHTPGLHVGDSQVPYMKIPIADCFDLQDLLPSSRKPSDAYAKSRGQTGHTVAGVTRSSSGIPPQSLSTAMDKQHEMQSDYHNENGNEDQNENGVLYVERNDNRNGLQLGADIDIENGVQHGYQYGVQNGVQNSGIQNDGNAEKMEQMRTALTSLTKVGIVEQGSFRPGPHDYLLKHALSSRIVEVSGSAPGARHPKTLLSKLQRCVPKNEHYECGWGDKVSNDKVSNDKVSNDKASEEGKMWKIRDTEGNKYYGCAEEDEALSNFDDQDANLRFNEVYFSDATLDTSTQARIKEIGRYEGPTKGFELDSHQYIEDSDKLGTEWHARKAPVSSRGFHARGERQFDIMSNVSDYTTDVITSNENLGFRKKPVLPPSKDDIIQARSLDEFLRERAERDLRNGTAANRMNKQKHEHKEKISPEMYEEGNYENEAEERLFKRIKSKVLRMRKECPSSAPNKLCFASNLSSCDHQDVKEGIESNGKVKVTTLQYDPVYLKEGTPDLYVGFWIFEVSKDSDKADLFLRGFKLKGRPMNVRSLDDVTMEEYRAYQMYNDILMEQRRKRLNRRSKRR